MDSDVDWNPGNNDPGVGGALDRGLNAFIRALPAGSPVKTELQRREAWLWDAVGRQEYGEPLTNWWDGKGSP